MGDVHLEEDINNLKKMEKDNVVNIKYTNKKGVCNMIYRYNPLLLDDVDILFSRDADSIINDRDQWCIKEFLNSRKGCHTIRDNYWHKSLLTGGLTGFNKKFIKNLPNLLSETKTIFDNIINDNFNYGDDENVLNKYLYPLVKDNILIHTNINAYLDEKYENIEYENDGINFCGNVLEYDENNNPIPQFKYNTYNLLEQLTWLSGQNQFKLMIKVFDDYGELEEVSYNNQANILDYVYIAHFYLKNLDECMNIYKNFYRYEITDHIKNNSKYFFYLARELKYKIVGTCNVDYEPKSDEIVIYFGDYPDDYMSLPQSNKIYRHVSLLDSIKLDDFIYDKCWDDIDQIYIMGLEMEVLRYYETLNELAKMNGPLHKVYRYKAKKDEDKSRAYIGATKNHVDCIKMMIDNKYNTCLFLEDDFVFTSTIKDNKLKLENFFDRKYDYDICFLSVSKYHRKEDYDDLLILSKQICTTSSGYLLNLNTINKVYDTVKFGLEELIRTNDPNTYCIDRYWSKLEKDNKVFIFKNKLGYQRPSMSNITKEINMYLD